MQGCSDIGHTSGGFLSDLIDYPPGEGENIFPLALKSARVG